MNQRRPIRSLIGVAAALSLTAGLTGCGGSTSSTPPNKDDSSARTQLNLGYSLLYQEAKGLTKVKYVVMIKSESDNVEKAVTAMTDYCGTVRDQMESMTKKYPALHINDNPMPIIMGHAREAMGKERFSHFVPIFGQTGTEYERNLLLMMRGAADEESHIAGAIAEKETDPGLNQYDKTVEAKFRNIRDNIQALLERNYFVHPKH